MKNSTPLSYRANSIAQFGSFPVVSLDRPDPHVAEPRRIPMILKADGTFALVGTLFGNLAVLRRPEDLLLLVREDAVVEHGHRRRFFHLPVLVMGGVEHDVVRLPLSRLAR